MNDHQRNNAAQLAANSINDITKKPATPFDNGASAKDERVSINTGVTASSRPTNPGKRRIMMAFACFGGISAVLFVESTAFLLGWPALLSDEVRLALTVAQMLTAIAAKLLIDMNKK